MLPCVPSARRRSNVRPNGGKERDCQQEAPRWRVAEEGHAANKRKRQRSYFYVYVHSSAARAADKFLSKQGSKGDSRNKLRERERKRRSSKRRKKRGGGNFRRFSLLRRPAAGLWQWSFLDRVELPAALSQCRVELTLSQVGSATKRSLFAHEPCFSLRGSVHEQQVGRMERHLTTDVGTARRQNRSHQRRPWTCVSRMPCAGCQISCSKRRSCRRRGHKKKHTERVVTISESNAARAAMEEGTRARDRQDKAKKKLYDQKFARKLRPPVMRPHSSPSENRGA